MDAKTHHQFMSLAVKLARKGLHTAKPNPAVGCVIAKGNQIIATGHHHQCGGQHAEVAALGQAGPRASGGTMYVNLEPCCHHGRTGPCTAAIIDAGIIKVFVASVDPNPLVNGAGIEALRKAGIEVELGLMNQQAEQLNRRFFHNVKHTKPYVIAKWAMSLDGQCITNAQDAPQISGSKASKLTQQLRKQVDAIMVGSRTIETDNPRLTARPDNQNKQPLRVILSSRGELPLDSNVFAGNLPGKTLLVTTNLISQAQLDKLAKHAVAVLVTKPDANNQVDLTELLNELWKMGVCSLLVEGGMATHQSFIRQNLVNEIVTYVAPVIVGNFERKLKLPSMVVKKIGDDCLLTSNLDV